MAPNGSQGSGFDSNLDLEAALFTCTGGEWHNSKLLLQKHFYNKNQSTKEVTYKKTQEFLFQALKIPFLNGLVLPNVNWFVNWPSNVL